MKVAIPDAPAIAELSFRFYRSEADYALMAEIYGLAMIADQNTMVVNAEEMAFWYASGTGYNPNRQLVIAEVAGTAVAYASAKYAPGNDGAQIYSLLGAVSPAWRRQGLGRALLHHNEALARRLASQEATTNSPIYEASAWETTTGATVMLMQEGYQPVRHFYSMGRPHLEEIPDASLPPGVEVRAVQPEHYRFIWQADQEAFAGTWGTPAPSEDAYAKWLADPFFDPSLWRIAWAGDQVVGQVRSFIIDAENEALGRLRGYTEYISVRRDWRRHGLATALIGQSLHALKAAGMKEAALYVDTDNPNRALQLYERCGFRAEQRKTVYHKPMYPDAQESDTSSTAPTDNA